MTMTLNISIIQTSSTSQPEIYLLFFNAEGQYIPHFVFQTIMLVKNFTAYEI